MNEKLFFFLWGLALSVVLAYKDSWEKLTKRNRMEVTKMDTLRMLIKHCKDITDCNKCDFCDDGLCEFAYEAPYNWNAARIEDLLKEVNHGTEAVSGRPGE